MRTLIGIVLLLVGIYFSYYSYNQIDFSTQDDIQEIYIGDTKATKDVEEKDNTKPYIILSFSMLTIIGGCIIIGLNNK